MSGRYQVKGLFHIYTRVRKSFRGLWVKKIEFLAKNKLQNRPFYPHFCKKNNRVIVHTLVTATARRPPVDPT